MPEYISMTEQLITIAGIAGFFLGLNGLLRWVVSRYSVPPIDLPVPKVSCPPDRIVNNPNPVHTYANLDDEDFF